ncbi:MAG: hypothetical protein ACLU4N_02575 [Butyricimonas faecihominis]
MKISNQATMPNAKRTMIKVTLKIICRILRQGTPVLEDETMPCGSWGIVETVVGQP